MINMTMVMKEMKACKNRIVFKVVIPKKLPNFGSFMYS